MKKNTRKHRLTLHRETLSALDQQLKGVQGGRTTIPSLCPAPWPYNCDNITEDCNTETNC